MRKITQEKLDFVFQDIDGILTFTMKSCEQEPEKPRFLYDGENQIFLVRNAGNVTSLVLAENNVLPILQKAVKVRFVEMPEDSSQIVRQFDVGVTKIKTIEMNDNQFVFPESLDEIDSSNLN